LANKHKNKKKELTAQQAEQNAVQEAAQEQQSEQEAAGNLVQYLNQEYTIKIFPDQGERVLSFRLTPGILRYAAASVVLGAIFFVGSFIMAAHGAFSDSFDREAVGELRSMRSSQQQQLTQIMKKLNNLQDEIDKLEEQENELKQLAIGGDLPEKVEPKEPAGQGGAYVQPGLNDLNRMLGELEKRLANRRQSVEALHELLKEQRKNSFGLGGMPLGIPATGDVSSPYGMRWGGSDFHPGIDIADDYGTPIYATASGVVTFAGWNSGGYGNMVEIDNGNGVTTLFAHAEQVLVTEGQQVKKGEIIALMGSTGFSTGPHVHYEISLNGERVNPANFF